MIVKLIDKVRLHVVRACALVDRLFIISSS